MARRSRSTGLSFPVRYRPDSFEVSVYLAGPEVVQGRQYGGTPTSIDQGRCVTNLFLGNRRARVLAVSIF